MTLLEHEQKKYEEGHAEGVAEGIELTKNIFRLSIQGKSIKEIALDCGMSENEVEEIIKVIK